MTTEERRVDEKGRITLPKELRDALGLEPGSRVRIERHGEEISVRPAVSRTEAIEALEGCITEENTMECDTDPMDPLGLDDPLK